MTTAFPANERTKRLEDMAATEQDVLVIGGGITGAGIALDAAARGLKTGLIDMQDFGAGTSSRSTKLVHGGLRYLKQLEVKLVAEVGKERAIVYENAPHVTTPEWMLLPLIEGGTFGRTSTSLGLKVYDLLAGVKKDERRYMLSKDETLQKEPLLKTDGLKGGGIYVEYRTDDARLTVETMKKAEELGTDAVNHAKVTDFIYHGTQAVGVYVSDQITGETYEIYAKEIVNAAGPWVDTLREKDGSKQGKYLHLTKGVHVVFDRERFPLSQAVYFDVPDGRMVFAIPRGNKTYVGTTDTVYDGDIANPRMTDEDLEYLIEASSAMFPELALTRDDVESSWAGLRPLIHEEGKSASEISRKDEVFISDSGLISIAGGKLTGYRKMAERIVDLLCERKGIHAPCPTADIPLSGGEVNGSTGFSSYIEKAASEGEALGLTREEAEETAKFYGSNAPVVFDLMITWEKTAEKHGLSRFAAGQLAYGVLHESAATALDILNRRTGWLFFDMPYVLNNQDRLLTFMGEILNWDEARLAAENEALSAEIEHLRTPEPVLAHA
ncbi:homodimeric glycerol 3-phosphate dehydrogenase (quinone) [Salsuginibacillus halophilus]|uniref:Glycerol-3-phosphate dehydrogenase n=1 Tax=Salsuginibacillus halophilus TaxID=517424 RepID=A0A2P8HG73_9BACI|nr:glycerol-3-phosphate dehydrogenase/oxidase [Salsuginibacillus halophilus]PSL45196.1 homodimeric glycerol 3-phosphate dehydrogenase (quinone) [Salsuginibacillus halophilus]